MTLTKKLFLGLLLRILDVYSSDEKPKIIKDINEDKLFQQYQADEPSSITASKLMMKGLIFIPQVVVLPSILESLSERADHADLSLEARGMGAAVMTIGALIYTNGEDLNCQNDFNQRTKLVFNDNRSFHYETILKTDSEKNTDAIVHGFASIAGCTQVGWMLANSLIPGIDNNAVGSAVACATIHAALTASLEYLKQQK